MSASCRSGEVVSDRSGDGWSGNLSGRCPVQGFGEVDGHGWYFRARGESWSFDINRGIGDDIMEDTWSTLWRTEGDYGEQKWDAGYMADDEAWGFVEASIAKFRKGEPSVGDGWETLK